MIPAPATWDQLHAALEGRRPLLVTYSDRRRLLCPHALGWKAHRALLLAYQTSGTTSDTLEAHHGWRCLYIDRIEDISPAGADATWTSAPTYNPARPFPAIDSLSAAVPG